MVDKEKDILLIFNYISRIQEEIFNLLDISAKKIDCFNKMADEYVSFCKKIGINMHDYLNDKSIAESQNTKEIKVEISKIPLRLRHETLVNDSKSLDNEKLSLLLLDIKLNSCINKLIKFISLYGESASYNKKDALTIYEAFFRTVSMSKKLSDLCKRNITLIDDVKKGYKVSAMYYMFAEKNDTNDNKKTM